MPRIIAFTGKKGVGKSYLAQLTDQIFYKEKWEIPNFQPKSSEVLIEQYAFADPIKTFLHEALGINKEHLYGNDKDKNSPTEYEWSKMPQWIRKEFGSPQGKITCREAMQIFGTQLMREIWGQDVWVKSMLRRIAKTDATWILVTDCRYQDEIDAIKNIGGKVWKIEGPQRGDDFAKIDNHSSEKVMDFTTNFDYVIENELSDNSDSLKAKIREALIAGFELRF